MERRGVQARPRLYSFFGLFLLAVFPDRATSSFLCLSFVFLYCWWSGRLTMTDQAGPGAREQGI